MKCVVRKAATLSFIATACLVGCPSKKSLDSLALSPLATTNGMKAAKAAADKMPDFQGAWTLSAVYHPQMNTAFLHIQIKPGFHAYGPGEKTGMPPAIDIDKTGGWELLAPPILPRGTKKKSAIGSEIVVLPERFAIELKVNKGQGNIHGVLHLQLCTDTLCDRPRAHSFEIKIGKN
jgi:hypothetical protein